MLVEREEEKEEEYELEPNQIAEPDKDEKTLDQTTSVNRTEDEIDMQIENSAQDEK